MLRHGLMSGTKLATDKEEKRLKDRHSPTSKLPTKFHWSRQCGTGIGIDIQVSGIESRVQK